MNETWIIILAYGFFCYIVGCIVGYCTRSNREKPPAN